MDKVLKYVTKQEIIKKIMSERFTIRSALNDMNHINANRPLNKTLYGHMWFNNDVSIYQSMYNIYDIETFYLNYMEVLYTFLNYIDKIEDILIIGLGGGHLPMLLNYHFPELKITIIELDSSVIPAAQHLGFKENANIKVIVGDGVEYCNTTDTNDYDACIIDLDSGITLEKFDYHKIKNLINQNGVLAINYFNPSKKDESLSAKLIPNFKTIKIYQTGHNYVYICKNTFVPDELLRIDNINHLLKTHRDVDEIIEKTNSVKIKTVQQ